MAVGFSLIAVVKKRSGLQLFLSIAVRCVLFILLFVGGNQISQQIVRDTCHGNGIDGIAECNNCQLFVRIDIVKGGVNPDCAVVTDAALKLKEHAVAVMRFRGVVGGHRLKAVRRNGFTAAQRVNPCSDICSIGNQVAAAVCQPGLCVDLLIGQTFRPSGEEASSPMEPV